MTIRFTDDGLSLGRREGDYEMGFFPHPRYDPHEAGKVLSLFGGIGVQSHVDYLSDLDYYPLKRADVPPRP